MADLRVLRERGLVRIRHADLADLRRAAVMAGAGHGRPRGIRCRGGRRTGGGGQPRRGDPWRGRAGDLRAGHRGTGRALAQIRRRRAALAYGVSVERFRKHHERIVLEQVGEEILKLSEPPAAARLDHPAARGTGPADRADRNDRGPRHHDRGSYRAGRAAARRRCPRCPGKRVPGTASALQVVGIGRGAPGRSDQERGRRDHHRRNRRRAASMGPG